MEVKKQYFLEHMAICPNDKKHTFRHELNPTLTYVVLQKLYELDKTSF